MTADTPTIRELETPDRVETRLDVHRRFILAVFEDPSLLDGILDESTLYPIPDDDPAFAARERAIGESRAAHGDRVTIRRVRLAELPA